MTEDKGQKMSFNDQLSKELEIIAEAIGQSMPARVRSIVNRKLTDLVSGYFPHIPVDQIMDLLKQYGLMLVQEDNTEFAGIFAGADGHAMIDVAPVGSGHEEHGMVAYVPFVNTILDITWHKMESGRYEVVAYLS